MNSYFIQHNDYVIFPTHGATEVLNPSYKTNLRSIFENIKYKIYQGKTLTNEMHKHL